ncbi:carboxymuconolactone decarboxylase family protein [Phenylobacterium sp. LjRoot225]|uniref:carboxymuconolactone decarboxylase family protein n=1 Tax=Phenylobacterium sp. LjRoot225 TaxID=3342285 RepID=UPI003ECFD644
MSLLDPAERTRRGVEQQAALTGAPAPEPKTLLGASWRDFIYAEVWTRPGLDLRSRFWIAMAAAACSPGPAEILDNYVRGALTTGEVTLSELREGALHLAVYAGWSRGGAWDQSITRVATSLDLAPAEFAPIRAEPWDPAVRHAEGSANFLAVMTIGGPPPVVAYFDSGILNFVFGEMWMRPGLDQRSRRWITMVGVSESSSDTPIRSHTYGAMASGNATMDEMHEFVLQYAIHGGWPKASVMQATVFEMGKRVAQGLPFEA